MGDIGIWAEVTFGWLRAVPAVISEMRLNDACCAW